MKKNITAAFMGLAAAWAATSAVAQSGDFVIRVPVTAVSYAPSVQNYNFGSVPVGARPVRNFQVYNRSTSSVSFEQVQVTGAAVIESNGCAQGLQAGKSCIVSVALPVNSEGTVAGEVRLVTSAAQTPEILRVAATGISAAAALQASPGSIAFGNVAVGASSSFQTITLKNVSTSDLYLGDLYLAENGSYFGFQSQCDQSLAPDATCTISIRFSPRLVGPTQARIVRDQEDGTQVYVASVSGTGVRAEATWAVGQANFVDVPVGQKSSVQEIGLTNTGAGDLPISNLAIFGDKSFHLENHTCGSVLAAKASCVVRVAVTPPDSFVRSASLRVESGALELRSSSVQLFSRPLVAAPVLTVEPSTLDFGSVGVGTSSNTLTFVLKSTGNASVGVVNYAITGPSANNFSIVNPANCIGLLTPGNQCTVSVRANPSAAGVRSAQISITSSSSEPVVPVSLRVTGIQGTLVAVPSPLSFGEVVAGQTKSLTSVVSNVGGAPVTVGSVSVGGANGNLFTVSGCSGQTLAPAGTCTLNVTYAPVANGDQTASLVLNNSGSEPSYVVPVSGTGRVLTPVVSMGAFTCPAQVQFNTNASCQAKFSNTGPVAVTVTGFTSSSNAFTVTHNCPASLSAGAQCDVTATVATGAPVAGGSRVITTTISSQTSAPASSSPLSLTAEASRLTINPGSYTPVAAGATQSVSHTVLNTGKFPVVFSGAPTISTVNPAGSFELGANTCTGTIQPGASCSVAVTCRAPATAGLSTASLSVAGSNGAQASGPLSCTSFVPVTAGNLSVTPNPASFGTVGLSQTTRQTLTVSNRNAVAVALDSVRVQGANPAEFTIVTNTCASVPALTGTTPGTCSVQVEFRPATVGAKTAELRVSSSSQNIAASGLLSGTGVLSVLTATPNPAAVTSTAVGSTSTQAVTVRNNGPVSVAFPAANTWAVRGPNAAEFSLSDVNCGGANLAASGTCSLNVRMTPTSVGAKSATVSFSATAAQPLDVAISGTATAAAAPVATLGPLNCAAPATAGGTSACTVVLTNTGNAALTFQQPTVATNADPRTFGATLPANAFKAPLCGANVSSLAPNGTCTFSFNANTPLVGLNTVHFLLPNNRPAAYATAAVQGVVATGQLATTNHPSTPLNVASSASHKLTNTSSVPLRFTAVTGPGFATVTGAPAITLDGTPTGGVACPLTLAPGASCDIRTKCQISSAGTHNGQLVVTTSAGAKISGPVSCVTAAPGITVTPAGPLTTVAGGHSKSGNFFRVENTGGGPVTFNAGTAGTTSWSLVADTANPNHCVPNRVIQPGSSCLIMSRLENMPPNVTHTAIHRVRVTSGATVLQPSFNDSIQSLGVSVVATQPFGVLQRGVPQEAVYTVTNLAAHALSQITPRVTGSPQLTVVSHTCQTGLAPSASCQVRVQISAATVGSVTGTVELEGGFPQVINNLAQATISRGLQGQASVNSSVSVPSATFLGGPFPSTAVGGKSTARFTLTNTGVGALAVTAAPSITGGAYQIVPAGTTCVLNASIAPQAKCDVIVEFSPTVAGPVLGQLSLTSTAGGHLATLAGVGALSNPLSLTAVNFGSTTIGNAVVRTLDVTNGSPNQLIVSSISLPATVTRAPSSPTDCAASNFSLAPGAKCTLRLTWLPSDPGTLSANMVFNSNYQGATSIPVALSGQATVGSLTPVAGSESCTRLSTVVGNTPTCAMRLRNTGTTDLLIDGYAFAMHSGAYSGIGVLPFTQVGSPPAVAGYGTVSYPAEPSTSVSTYFWSVNVDGKALSLLNSPSLRLPPGVTEVGRISTGPAPYTARTITYSNGVKVSDGQGISRRQYSIPPGAEVMVMFSMSQPNSWARQSGVSGFNQACFPKKLPADHRPFEYCFDGPIAAAMYLGSKGRIVAKVVMGATITPQVVDAAHNAPSAIRDNQVVTVTLTNNSIDPMEFTVTPPNALFPRTPSSTSDLIRAGMRHISGGTCPIVDGNSVPITSFLVHGPVAFRLEPNTSCTALYLCEMDPVRNGINKSTGSFTITSTNYVDGLPSLEYLPPSFQPTIKQPFRSTKRIVAPNTNVPTTILTNKSPAFTCGPN